MRSQTTRVYRRAHVSVAWQEQQRRRELELENIGRLLVEWALAVRHGDVAAATKLGLAKCAAIEMLPIGGAE